MNSDELLTMAGRSGANKISPGFLVRLRSMEPNEHVRAMVMLNAEPKDVAGGRRGSRRERDAAIEALRQSAEPGLVEIDSILAKFQGKRLGNHVDALGFVPVETTPEGIAALASLEQVRLLLEDQPVTLLHP